MSQKFVVVGAGISGLATAWHLMKRGAQVTVLEASDRPGGVIGTVDRDGFLMESAATGFVDREPLMRDLLDGLELSSRVRPAAPQAKLRYVFTRGAVRPVPTAPPAILKSDLLPLGARLRLLAELLSRRGSGEDESVASFARRHIGKRATAVLIDAVQTGIFAGDMERLSVGATFPKMVELERTHRSLILALIARQRAARTSPSGDPRLTGVLSTFDRGMQALPDALAAALGSNLHLNSPVRGLQRRGASWHLTLDGQELEADHVVLATPAYASAELVRTLNEGLAEELAAISYAPVSAVHLAWDHTLPPVEGFGFLVPSEEGRRILGALYVSSFFPHRAPAGSTLLTVMVGGARHPEQVTLDDAALTGLVREELASTLGIEAAPRFIQVVRWSRGIPQYELGHLARMTRIDSALAALPNLHLTGNAYRGIAVLDCVRNAHELAVRLTS